MCGICGQVLLDKSRDIVRSTIISMISRMVHRGPDSSGFYHSRYASIGMRRLSLVDLAGGDQPIFNEDQSMAIVMNGEIYNFRELRKKLETNHTFTTTSDTEVVLHLFEEHGESAFKMLEGMYAIAIIHISSGNSWIARDPFGIKPLYWTSNRGILSFSSELASLYADSSIPKELSYSALGEYFTFGYVRGEQSIFDSVRRLSPGHYLKIEDGIVQEECFYPFGELLRPSVKMDKEEAITKLEYLLSEVVPSYQAADVPVAAFLSGGIDSSLVCKYMQWDNPSTYSMAFRNSSFHDESHFAAEVAGILGSRHNSISIDYPDIDTILEVLSFFGEPFADSSAIPTFLVSREIAKDVKAALSGDGADEVFMGYTQYQGAYLAKYLRFLPLKNSLSKSLRLISAIGSGRSEALDTAARRLEIAGVPITQQLLDKQSMFSGERASINKCLTRLSKQAITNSTIFEKHLEILSNRSVSLLKRLSYIQLVLNLPSGILTKVDRAAMANSLEVRIPFLDSRIVSFAFSLPDNLKLRQLQTKYVLRQLASKYYPDSISKRPKHGFTVPLLDWFAGSMGRFLKQQMADSAAGDKGLINPTEVISIVNSHQAGTVNAASTLFSMLVLEQWAKRWF